MKKLLVLITMTIASVSFAQAGRQCTIGDLNKAQVAAMSADMSKNRKSVLFNKGITIRRADADYINPEDALSRSAKDLATADGAYAAGSVSFLDTTYDITETVAIYVKLNKNCAMTSYKMVFLDLE